MTMAARLPASSYTVVMAPEEDRSMHHPDDSNNININGMMNPSCSQDTLNMTSISGHSGGSGSTSIRSHKKSNLRRPQQEEGEDTKHPSAASRGASASAATCTFKINEDDNDDAGDCSENDDQVPPSNANATAAVAAARLPNDENLYESLVRYQEDLDDNTTVSMPGDAMRSISTGWYSVQSDDDRKIPARPSEETEPVTYREPTRRHYCPPDKSVNGCSNVSSNDGTDCDYTNPMDNTSPAVMASRHGTYNGAAVAPHTTAAGTKESTIASQSSNSPSRTVPSHDHVRVASTTPPKTRTGSASIETSPTPPVTFVRAASEGRPAEAFHDHHVDDEDDDDKDDQTTFSSVVASTITADEGFLTTFLSHFPMDGLDEEDIVLPAATTNTNMATRYANPEFSCLSSAAQLAQESNIGNMVETTRSAPNPYEMAVNGGCSRAADPISSASEPDWNSMEWAFQNLLLPTAAQHASDIAPQPKSNLPNTTSLPRASRSRNSNSMTTTTSTRSVDPPSRNRATGNNFNPNNNHNSRPMGGSTPVAPSPAPVNDYIRMQQTLGMQNLPAPPGSTSSASVRSSASLGIPSNASLSHSLPPSRQAAAGSISSHSQGTPSAISGNLGTPNPRNLPASMASSLTGSSAMNSCTNNNNVDPPSADAEEQYRIWKQIQEELERKEMELALQLSQKDAKDNNSVNAGNNNSGSSGGIGGFVYPSQEAKPPTTEGSNRRDGDLDEEEALKVALQISEEEAAAQVNADSNGNEEDEIALALRLSEEQAEEDRRRLQQLQATAGEMSEEEQLRLAMEQSMEQQNRQQSASASTSSFEDDEIDGDEDMRRALAESLQQPQQVRPQHTLKADDLRQNDFHNDAVDDDMELALRLSQQMEDDERRRRQGFATGAVDRSSEDCDGSFRNFIQPFPSQEDSFDFSAYTFPTTVHNAGIIPPLHTLQDQPSPSPVGRWKDLLRGKSPTGSSGIPDAVPPPHIPKEDLDTLSDHEQAAFLRNFKAMPGARVHAPDDGNDVPPVSRPQRQQGQQQRESDRTVVDIDKESRDVMIREGQSETRAAILQGQSQIVTCRGCLGKLHAPMNCALVFCPNCNTVSPLDET